MKSLALVALALVAACAPRREPPKEERRQVIDGLTLSQSSSGKPAWTLRSRLAILREDEKLAELSAPAMDFYRLGKVVSRVTARGGTVNTETHDVRLSSSVVLDSLDDRSHLTTEELLYSSARGRFVTSADVQIRRPEGVVRGRGLEATPDLSEIRIYEQRSVLNGKGR
ncbi:MAG: LPS export ABC transporter periplasmic protein LptC [Elusimicrobia bacterium RBG_16_66_12]|nr:MAG: LPS export ABC transporter periplasmic protein LptC [Elusimicrobia bacterium RBG_16_66_12]